ncbi:DUF433 domain-containing protein [Spirillospora sp. NPDC048824]|uniref:DUF433 domain-containing protein n=1 Tax=Spirillospora sp. NPDC048824 TaxID=3364526 RepID=UPI003722D5BC
MSVVDLLDRPVYGMAQVDRLLRLKSGTARRWIDGYWRNSQFYEPIVRLSPTGGALVTWGEFVEARLLSEYRDAGVRINKMRAVVAELRDHFGDYPLAKSAPFISAEGQEVVLRIQTDVDLDEDLQLVRLGSNGQLMLSAPVREFMDAVKYHDGRAAMLHPAADIPQVVIDPLRASGDPVVRAVPTEVIIDLTEAGDSPEWIAEMYDLELAQVEAAIRFEQRRRAA